MSYGLPHHRSGSFCAAAAATVRAPTSARAIRPPRVVAIRSFCQPRLGRPPAGASPTHDKLPHGDALAFATGGTFAADVARARAKRPRMRRRGANRETATATDESQEPRRGRQHKTTKKRCQHQTAYRPVRRPALAASSRPSFFLCDERARARARARREQGERERDRQTESCARESKERERQTDRELCTTERQRVVHERELSGARESERAVHERELSCARESRWLGLTFGAGAHAVPSSGALISRPPRSAAAAVHRATE